MVRKATFTVLCIFLCSILNAENRYALTVFISEYPKESGWNHINSSNDKKVIIPMLPFSSVSALSQSRAWW